MYVLCKTNLIRYLNYGGTFEVSVTLSLETNLGTGRRGVGSERGCVCSMIHPQRVL